MDQKLKIDDITITVIRKNIKNMYIRILPQDGEVRMTVPRYVKDKQVMEFALSKLSWIKKHKASIEKQEPMITLQYVSGETHLLWGKPYTLEVLITTDDQRVVMEDSKIFLYAKKSSTCQQREDLLEAWYRKLLRQAIDDRLPKYIEIVGKTPTECRIKNMKTRWGSCNIVKKRIWLNLQLVKKPPQCLDYVITHELVHLYVRNHNHEFKAYMDVFYPEWRAVNKLLNYGSDV